MMNKVKAGYMTEGPVESPNLWRVFAGDRLAWVGASQPDATAEGGVLGIIDFRANALVVGEPFDFSLDNPTFAAFDRNDPAPESVTLCHNGYLAVCRYGVPSTFTASSEWKLGS